MPDWWPLEDGENTAEQVPFNLEISVSDRVYGFQVVPIEGMDYRNLYGKDITEGKRAEEEMQQSEEKFCLLFNAVNDAIGVNDLNPDWSPGQYIEVNDALCQWLGYSREELVQLTPLDIVNPSDVQAILDMRKTLIQDREYLTKRTIIAKDGRKIPVELHTQVLNLRGQPVVLSIARNIEKRQEAEDLVQLYVAEIERSNKELEEYAAVISHDLKSPLTAICGYAELVEKRFKEELGPTGLDFTNRIIRNATRMNIMIDAMLAVASLKVDPSQFEAVDCEEILSNVIEDLGFSISSADAAVIHDHLPVVTGIKPLLTQVFANLINNAIKFRREGVGLEIRISACESLNEWTFSVQDNGIGLKPEQAKTLFRIFRRLHSQGEYPGTGVGLSTCRKIIEKHGGKIWADSQPSKGSTFYFTLPKLDYN